MRSGAGQRFQLRKAIDFPHDHFCRLRCSMRTVRLRLIRERERIA
jgi:hypothetical protein